MKEYRLTDWLPTTKKEVELRGWNELDVILFSGDAYVDHPSFGAAVVGRILEAEGLRIAIVPQPNWRDDLRDFKSWDVPAYSSVSVPAAWTLWSINIRQTSVFVVMMPIHRMPARICDRNIRPSFIPKS